MKRHYVIGLVFSMLWPGWAQAETRWYEVSAARGKVREEKPLPRQQKDFLPLPARPQIAEPRRFMPAARAKGQRFVDLAKAHGTGTVALPRLETESSGETVPARKRALPNKGGDRPVDPESKAQAILSLYDEAGAGKMTAFGLLSREKWPD